MYDVLTSPYVLNDKSIIFPAVIFVGKFDMIITNTIPRAFLSGRRYHSSSHDVLATLSAYYQYQITKEEIYLNNSIKIYFTISKINVISACVIPHA